MEREIRQTSSAREFLQNQSKKFIFGSPSPKFYLHCLQLSQTATLFQVNIGNPEISSFFILYKLGQYTFCLLNSVFANINMRLGKCVVSSIARSQLFKYLPGYKTSRLQSVKVKKRQGYQTSILHKVQFTKCPCMLG